MVIKENEPLKAHTTLRIGGTARYYLIPQSIGEVRDALDFADGKRLPYYIIGRGSNLLFSDREYKGVVIEIGQGLKEITFNKTYVTAMAGVPLNTLSKACMERSFTGLEFAGGIPGTVGGAVVMNAGAYGGEIKDILISVQVLDEESFDITEIDAKDLELSYRHSVFQDQKGIILSADFNLQKGDKKEIETTMEELNKKRMEKQPLNYPSAGSTFKRPEGSFAGKLIEEAGLKGYRIGDAAVSEKHAGFVVNLGDATASEVYALIKLIQDRVEKNSGIKLVPEVRMVGDFSWDLEVY